MDTATLPTTTTTVPPLARRAAALQVLTDRIDVCSSCSAARPASKGRRVVGVGPMDARIAVIGEAPGAEEERTGVPFVGQAGTVLDTWLERAGVRRAELRIFNAVSCRPTSPGVRPGTECNRAPTDLEAAACRIHALTQLQIVSPAAVVVAGARALRLLARAAKLSVAALGTSNNYAVPSAGGGFEWYPAMPGSPPVPRGIRVFAVYHPSYVMQANRTGPAEAKRLQELAIETFARAAAYVAEVTRG